MFAIAALQLGSLILAQRAFEQPIAQLLHAAHLLAELFWWKLMTLTMKMDGKAKQSLHGPWPKSRRIQIDHCLQVAQLMRQADLTLPGRSLQLGGQAITDPDFGSMLPHHVLNNIRTAIKTDHMQNAAQRAE